MISVNQKWVYLVVITSVKFSCFVSVIFGGSVVLMSLFSLFYVTCEGSRFLSTEAELSVIFITSHTHYGLISDFLKTCPHCRVNVSPVQIDVVRNQESLVKDKLSLLVFLSTKKNSPYYYSCYCFVEQYNTRWWTTDFNCWKATQGLFTADARIPED